MDEFVIKIGHVDCKKETYDILRTTVTPYLNEDLKELMNGNKKILVFKRLAGEGKYLYTCQINKYTPNTNGDDGVGDKPQFICPVAKTPIPEFEFVKPCRIRIVMTGDLAFYAAVLGKPNSASHWCMWCQHSYSVWKEYGHEAGTKWTLECMCKRREQIFNKELEDTAINRKGITKMELIEAIQILQYIYPILHSEIGLGNYLLNSFFDWIDFRIEKVSDEEKNLRRDFGFVIKDVDVMKEKWDEFCNGDGISLGEYIVEKAHLTETKEQRGDDGIYILSLEERKELETLIKEIAPHIKELKRKKKEVEDDLNLKKKMYATVKKKLEVYEKKEGENVMQGFSWR